jgi:hypothetical protein
MSRDEADRWAAQWVAADESDVPDPAVWDALTQLYGVDLRPGPDLPYLFDDAQIEGWLRELRAAP